MGQQFIFFVFVKFSNFFALLGVPVPVYFTSLKKSYLITLHATFRFGFQIDERNGVEKKN